MSLVHDGYEEDLEAIWADNPKGIVRPGHVDRVVPELLDPVAVGTDSAALAAFGRWAMQDAGNRRLRGVRGLTAYVTVPEPRLLARGIERVYFLRETASHVIVMCTSSSSEGELVGRMLVRLPRTGEDWDRWAACPGGALLAAYLTGAYRDMVVPLDVDPFVEHMSSPRSADANSPVRLEPVGYLPARRRPRRRGAAGLVDRLRPTPHQVTWYIRRLASGQRARPDALARAAAVGMTVPPGYTFVDTYFWPRATDPRSAATALRATVAVSSLRALLQTATMQPPKPVAEDVSRENGSSHRSAGTNGSAHSEPASSQTTALPPPTAPRPWWAFWRRG
jgi:hypothetical protein